MLCSLVLVGNLCLSDPESHARQIQTQNDAEMIEGNWPHRTQYSQQLTIKDQLCVLVHANRSIAGFCFAFCFARDERLLVN